MAEYSSVALQTVPAGGNVIFTETEVPCTRGFVIHREGSGLFTLRSMPRRCFTRYVVSFGGNIGLPAGGTVGPIELSIAINGEGLQSSTMITEIAAVEEDLNNVGRTIAIAVPYGCCLMVSVKNTTAQPITVKNATISIGPAKGGA